MDRMNKMSVRRACVRALVPKCALFSRRCATSVEWRHGLLGNGKGKQNARQWMWMTASSSGDNPSDSGDSGWEEIDKLIRELDENSSKETSGNRKEINTDDIWESIDSLMASDSDTQQQPSPPVNYNSFTVAELKEKLKVLGLPVSGRKAELIDRLKEAAGTTNQTPEFLQGEVPSLQSNLESSEASLLWGKIEEQTDLTSFQEEGKHVAHPVFADAELKFEPLGQEMQFISRHFAERGGENDSFEDLVPVDSVDLLGGYDSLPEGYTWRGNSDDHPKFPGYSIFSLSCDLDFLVKCEDGKLDLQNIYACQKSTNFYFRPEMRGRINEKPCQYYAYPYVQWYPGDALKAKQATQEVVKLILVEIENDDPNDFELNVNNTVVLDGLEKVVQGMQESPDYEMSRNGKCGKLTSVTWNSFSFPKPFLLQFNEGHAFEDGSQLFGVCVGDDELNTQRWVQMTDPSDLVEEKAEIEKVEKSKEWTASKTGVEEGSPFEFVGSAESHQIESEWKALGLDKGVPPDFDVEITPQKFRD